MIKKFLKDETGMETVEWAVVAAIILLGAVVAFQTLGDTVDAKITALDTEINN